MRIWGIFINKINESAEIAKEISNKLSNKIQDTMVKHLKTYIENLRNLN